MAIAAPPGSPPALIEVARQINEELARRDNPTRPVRLPFIATADLPAAADFKNCVALTDGNAIVTSDGTGWI